jgi:hypothetical protein
MDFVTRRESMWPGLLTNISGYRANASIPAAILFIPGIGYADFEDNSRKLPADTNRRIFTDNING